MPSLLSRSASKTSMLHITLIALGVTASLFVNSASQARKAETRVADPDLKMREEMVSISRQLGVTCTHCHNPANFRSAEKKTFGIAKEHMKLVRVINGPHGLGGKPKIDCYACHRGEARYVYQEPKGGAPGGSSNALGGSGAHGTEKAADHGDSKH